MAWKILTGEDALNSPYLRTREAAEYLKRSTQDLEKRRLYGNGPIYSKTGGVVLYRRVDLDAWIEAGMRRSTSDAGDAA